MAVKKTFNDKTGHFNRYDLLLKSEKLHINFRNKSYSLLPETSLNVSKKYLGLATQVILENSSLKQTIFWFWNHGKIGQVVDTAPDPWFENSDDYLWAVEMAYLIAQSTNTKAFLTAVLPRYSLAHSQQVRKYINCRNQRVPHMSSIHALRKSFKA